MTVECPDCGVGVVVPVEWQTPTIPPMVPVLPTRTLVRGIGHVCSERDLLVETLSRLANGR
jgi:uncharacterized membrane protein